MFNPDEQMRILQFIAIETGTYNQIFERPFRTAVTQDLHNEILNRMVPAKEYGSSFFSDVAQKFISPDINPGKEVGITGGWASKRARWVMKIEWKSGLGVQKIQVLTGYSDPIDPTYSGILLDPRAPLYINNSFVFRVVNINTPMGFQSTLTPTTGGQVIIDNNYAGINTQNVKILGRPYDVANVSLVNPYERQELFQRNPVTVANSLVTNSAVFSNRENANPASYMSKLLDAHRKSINEHAVFNESEDKVKMATVRHASDISPNQDSFLNLIRNMNNKLIYENSFTLNDLSRIDPNIFNPAIKHEFTLDQFSRNQMNNPNGVALTPHYVGQTQPLNGSDHHTKIAVTLANAVPGIMANVALSNISAYFTNMEGGTNFHFGCSRINSFISDINLAPMAEAFQIRVTNELLNALSFNHGIALSVAMHIDMLGDTRLEITINNERIDYCIPTFCDALYSPVLQNRNEDVVAIGQSFGALMSDMYTNEAMKYGQAPNLMHDDYSPIEGENTMSPDIFNI